MHPKKPCRQWRFTRKRGSQWRFTQESLVTVKTGRQWRFTLKLYRKVNFLKMKTQVDNGVSHKRVKLIENSGGQWRFTQKGHS